MLEGAPGTGSTIVYKFLYYHLDHLGTPMALTDGTKDIVWSSDYYPFGSLYDEQVVQSNELRFPGQYHDRESDLYYNWHRYYEPELGRYITPDPLGLGAGDVNLYRYAGGNPAKRVDVSGLTVHLCSRDTEINDVVDWFAGLFGMRHQFIKTDTKVAGMSNAGGGPLPLYPVGIPTVIGDHMGQVSKADCVEIKDIDEECVNRELEIGKSIGRWWPWHNCNTWAGTVLWKCQKDKKVCETAAPQRAYD